ncbi:hypothetical protein IW140_003664 [Coemansia sp. RSA 1813]|nr:hypothetical protein EV179_003622 [Coemansia sp. RSA 487]KAJ2568675.1 hypothetical protein IW140_003664 [Coemansia sp. RSA 1813]
MFDDDDDDNIGDITPVNDIGARMDSVASPGETKLAADNAMPSGVKDPPVQGKGEESQQKHSWSTIQDRLRTSVVSIMINRPTAFEESCATFSYATGFVVDSEQGLIMSNRHVMGTGPSFHKAVFFGNQEVFLQPTYYDPVHDFAFFRYNPSELQDVEPKAIRLAPEKARSGLEFRIVGNTSNEKMSVHQGELSQLDRNPPVYDGSYSDFNTFYFQASSNSKGGSSGSPVVDIEGDAVAINCGAKHISSNVYLLPLERAAYALGYVKRGLVPPRGTLQTVFKHVNHTEIGRLGLSPDMACSEGVNIKETTGMLKIEKILPDGPASNVLSVGDILISVNSKPVPGFLELSETIDASVDKELGMRVFRKGQFYNHRVSVGNIYDITPSKLVRIGGTHLCNISYQQAVKWSAPIYGVTITHDSNGFIPHSSYGRCGIIYAANGKPTPNVDALMDILRDAGQDKPVVFKTKNHRDLRDEAVFVARHPPVAEPNIVYTRSPATGIWSIEPYSGMSATAGAGAGAGASGPRSFSPELEPEQPHGEMVAAVPKRADTFVSRRGSQMFVQAVSNSAVSIVACPITPADGQYSRISNGTGVIVDRRQGIVLCSTDVVKNPTCNVWITFAGLVCIEAKLAYTHPLYPISFLKYKPEQLFSNCGVDIGSYAVIDEIGIGSQTCQDGTSDTPLSVGTSVTVVLGAAGENIEIISSTVDGRRILSTKTCGACVNPRYFNTNVFFVSPEPSPASSKLGIVYSCDGSLCGIWVRLPHCIHSKNHPPFVGLDVSLVRSALAALQLDRSDVGSAHILDAEFAPVTLDTAHVFGAGNAHIKEVLRTTSAHERQMFKVDKTLHKREQTGSDSLEVGDVVLTIDGQLATRIGELACIYGRSSVALTVVRDMKEIPLAIETVPLSGISTRRVVCWAGMVMQEPHEAALEKANRVPSKVFMFRAVGGSPVYSKGHEWNVFITEIDDQPIKTLDDMVEVARRLKSSDAETFNTRVASNEAFSSGKMPGCDAKIHSVTLAGEDNVYSIRTNDHYFPAWQIRRGPLADDDWLWEAL